MLYLFHGEDQADSRQKFRAFIDGYIAKGIEPIYLNGVKLSGKDLESTLHSSSLFNQSILVIEGLFARPKSKERDAILKLLSDYTGDQPVVMWEKKELTKTQQTSLGKKTQLSLSKLPTLIFIFLESLYPGNYQQSIKLFHQVLIKSDEILVFTLLTRHIANLLIAQSAIAPKFSPWQLAKLKSQSAKWTDSGLVFFHDSLVNIDHQIKSGATKLDYTSQLDILLLSALR